MIFQHQDNVAAFAGGHTTWFLPQQLSGGAIAAGSSVSFTWTSVGKIFLYTDAQWGPNVELHLESTYRATTGTVAVRLYNITDATAVASSQLSTIATGIARERTAALTLTDGKEYRMQVGVDVGAAGAILGGHIVSVTPA